MKIVHCVFTMDTGGAQILIVDILNKLVLNNSVYLIVVNDRINIDLVKQIDSKVNIYFLNRKEGSLNPIPILRLNYLLLKINPDLIHCHEPNISILFFNKRIKSILTIHDVVLVKIKQNRYCEFVAISNSVFDFIFKHYKISPVIIRNGIQFSSFEKKIEYDYTSKKTFKIVQVSRLLYEKKGQDIIIKAVSYLIKQKKINNISLSFIGEGPSLNYLTNLCLEQGILEYVEFLGDMNQNWVKQNLKHFHLLVQPSRYEGFGLSILEAVAAGIIPLASNIDGPLEILSQWSKTLTFESENIEELAERILDIYSLYINSNAFSLHEELYNVLSLKYSSNIMVDNYFNLYSKIVYDEKYI